MQIQFTPRFREMFAALPEDIQRKAEKAIRLLENDWRHPSLQVRPIRGA